MTKTTLRALNNYEVYKTPFDLLLDKCLFEERVLFIKYNEFPKRIFILIDIKYDKKN